MLQFQTYLKLNVEINCIYFQTDVFRIGIILSQLIQLLQNTNFPPYSKKNKISDYTTIQLVSLSLSICNMVLLFFQIFGFYYYFDNNGDPTQLHLNVHLNVRWFWKY